MSFQLKHNTKRQLNSFQQVQVLNFISFLLVSQKIIYYYCTLKQLKNKPSRHYMFYMALNTLLCSYLKIFLYILIISMHVYIYKILYITCTYTIVYSFFHCFKYIFPQINLLCTKDIQWIYKTFCYIDSLLVDLVQTRFNKAFTIRNIKHICFTELQMQGKTYTYRVE